MAPQHSERRRRLDIQLVGYAIQARVADQGSSTRESKGSSQQRQQRAKSGVLSLSQKAKEEAKAARAQQQEFRELEPAADGGSEFEPASARRADEGTNANLVDTKIEARHRPFSHRSILPQDISIHHG